MTTVLFYPGLIPEQIEQKLIKQNIKFQTVSNGKQLIDRIKNMSKVIIVSPDAEFGDNLTDITQSSFVQKQQLSKPTDDNIYPFMFPHPVALHHTTLIQASIGLVLTGPELNYIKNGFQMDHHVAEYQWSSVLSCADVYLQFMAQGLVKPGCQTYIKLLDQMLLAYYESGSIDLCQLIVEEIAMYLSQSPHHYLTVYFFQQYVLQHIHNIGLKLRPYIRYDLQDFDRVYIVLYDIPKYLDQRPLIRELKQKEYKRNYIQTLEQIKEQANNPYIITIYDKDQLIPEINQMSNLALDSHQYIQDAAKVFIKIFEPFNYDCLVKIPSGTMLAGTFEDEVYIKDSCLVVPKSRSQEYLNQTADFVSMAYIEQQVMNKPRIDWPSENITEKYTVFVGSNRTNYVQEIRNQLPGVVWMKGNHYPSFSKLVNDCIRACTTEIFIFISDKVRPTKDHIEQMVQDIKKGYGLVFYSFARFGFKLDLIRTIGFMDERYIGGGYEDNDFVNRVTEARLPIFQHTASDYTYSNTAWSYSHSKEFYHLKWGQINTPDGMVLVRQLPDIPYMLEMGPLNDPNWFDSSLPNKADTYGKFPPILQSRRQYQNMPREAIINWCYQIKPLDFSQFEVIPNLCRKDTVINSIKSKIDSVHWMYLQTLSQIINVYAGTIVELTDRTSMFSVLDNPHTGLRSMPRFDLVQNWNKDMKVEGKYDLVIYNAYCQQPRSVQLFKQARLMVKPHGHILICEMKMSSDYDAQIYHGMHHILWKLILDRNWGQVVTIPVYPAACLVQV